MLFKQGHKVGLPTVYRMLKQVSFEAGERRMNLTAACSTGISCVRPVTLGGNMASRLQGTTAVFTVVVRRTCAGNTSFLIITRRTYETPS